MDGDSGTDNGSSSSSPEAEADKPRRPSATSRQFRFRLTTKVKRDIVRKQRQPRDTRLHRAPIIRDFKRKLSWPAKMTKGAKEAYVTLAYTYLSSTFLEGAHLLDYRQHKKLTTRELEYNEAVRKGAFAAVPLSAGPPPPTLPLAQAY